MKIAVFSDSFLPGHGGTEHAVYGVCKGFTELGHEVLLFAPDYHCGREIQEFRVYRLKSIKVTASDMAALVSLELKNVIKIARAFAPDIIYYCSASGLAKCALKAGKKLGVPTVATIHTKFKESFYDATKSKLISYIVTKNLVSKLNKTDKVTTVSRDMKRELKAYGYKGEVQVIKNGVPHKCEKIENANCGIDGTVNFIFCGRLAKVKNVQFSLKSLSLLKREKNFSDFKFIIVGKGDYEKKLKKLVRKEGLSDNVEFAGYYTDRSELDALYARAHLLLFPSVFDNDSLVILEAADNGVPTVTFKDCGSGERITDGVNGFLTENDVRKFAEKIYSVINDKELYKRVRQNVHTIIAKSWSETAKEYIAVFEETSKGKN